jgi:hypothetical protein
MLKRDSVGLSPALWFAGLGGVAFAAFAFKGVGWTPFLWALGLGVLGVPIYLLMRRLGTRRAAAGAT